MSEVPVVKGPKEVSPSVDNAWKTTVVTNDSGPEVVSALLGQG